VKQTTHPILRRISAILLFTSASLLPTQAQHSANATPPFYLHDGDTVVFYGDSITEQRYYTQWVALYTATRFPHMRVHFFNEGYGGDRVTGGGAGPIDQRLTRDVFPDKPTVVTIMLGMNDGGYETLTPAIENAYTQGYDHILTSIQKAAPTARLTLFGPSPYDEVTRPDKFPGGYNTTLRHFADLDRNMAGKYRATFIDLNEPFNAALKKGYAMNPLAVQLLLPDRVHPEGLAHWFMADAILKGWHAPSIVSSVTIDAAKKTILDAQNAQITELTGDPTSLRWTELDGALPLPFDELNVGVHFLHQLVDIDRDLNQQPLKIEGLKPGLYALNIDGRLIGTFPDTDLAKGINLAKLATPMRSQASTVQWQVRDREETHFVRLRMFVAQNKTGVSAEPAAAELTKFEQLQEKMLYEAAQPKPHTFLIQAAQAQTAQTPQ
jgi:lysophospholipase L1-like esterase